MLNEAGQQLGDDTNNAPARACNTRRMLNELRLLPGESATLGWVVVAGGGGGGGGGGNGRSRPSNLLHLSNGPRSAVPFPFLPRPAALRVDFWFCFRFTYQNN